MPITPSDIQNLVLKEDDFGHEMRVGKIIRDIPNIRVEHSGTYTDAASGKPRQFDFRCSLRKDAAELHLAVECKNLNPYAPVVMCGTKRQDNEAFHDLVESRWGLHSRGKKKDVIVDGLSSVTFRASREDTIYLPSEFVGKNIVRGKPAQNQSSPNALVSVPDSDVYDKWAQALSSSVGLVELACERAEHYRVSEFYTAILPIVVVPNDSLWMVDYDDTGSILKQPKLVNTCELFIGREITVTEEWMPHQFTFSHIHFFTIIGFSSFLSSMASNNVLWNKLFTGAALEI